MTGMNHAHLPLLAGVALALAPGVATAQDEPSSGEDNAEVTAENQETETTEQKEDKRRLSDRIKSVQRKAFLKRGRVEIYPNFALDLNDPFYQHLALGLGVSFHLADSLALEARGGGVFASIEQSAIRFVRQETDSLLEDPPEFQWHADANLQWAPFYGKISLFGEGILHFDTYLSVGGGVFSTDAAVNPAGNIGLGQRYFLTDWLTARVEARNYIFLDSRNGESDVQNLLALNFSVSIFFPFSFEYEYQ